MMSSIDVSNEKTHLAVTSAITLFNNMNSSVKTPISLLQEICMKCHVQAVFEELSGEVGKLNNTTFVFKVCAGDITSMGKGPSKKKAKHNAAVGVLKEIRDRYAGKNDVLAAQIDDLLNQVALSEAGGTAVATQSIQKDDNTAIIAVEASNESSNPVGELIEFTQKNALRPPEFEYGSEEGPPHARQFSCTVVFGEINEVGIGRSKKDAKRQAALKLLDKIKISDKYKQQVDNSNDQNKNGTKQVNKEQKPCVNAKNIHNSFNELKITDKPCIKSLILNELQENENEKNSQLLLDISKENNFDIEIFELPVKSKSDKEQVLIKLKLNPVTVFHGSGNTREQALNQSIFNALTYLQLFCTRKESNNGQT